MSNKYHINEKTGRPNICRAEIKECPVGGEHYESKEEARAGYEQQQKDKGKALKTLKKSSKKNSKESLKQQAVESAAKDGFNKKKYRAYLDKAYNVGESFEEYGAKVSYTNEGKTIEIDFDPEHPRGKIVKIDFNTYGSSRISTFDKKSNLGYHEEESDYLNFQVLEYDYMEDEDRALEMAKQKTLDVWCNASNRRLHDYSKGEKIDNDAYRQQIKENDDKEAENFLRKFNSYYPRQKEANEQMAESFRNVLSIGRISQENGYQMKKLGRGVVLFHPKRNFGSFKARDKCLFVTEDKNNLINVRVVSAYDLDSSVIAMKTTTEHYQVNSTGNPEKDNEKLETIFDSIFN